MGRRAFACVILAGTMAAFLGCSQFKDSETLRYRLTIEVETPEGLKSGYSVWEYTLAYSAVDDNTGLTSTYNGDAVAVDLPNGQTLFAVFSFEDGSPEYPEHLIQSKLKEMAPRNSVDGKELLQVVAEWQRSGNVSWTVPRRQETGCVQTQNCDNSNYPMLVTFKDIRDPKSVVQVDPDNLSASFGNGYTLRAIRVQVTGEPITTGIQKRFPWWDQYKRNYFDESSTVAADMQNSSLVAHMSSFSFSTEKDK